MDRISSSRDGLPRTGEGRQTTNSEDRAGGGGKGASCRAPFRGGDRRKRGKECTVAPVPVQDAYRPMNVIRIVTRIEN